MVNKKGQAAMEYLMTYGWAILVIVIVLAALLYLGVFNIGTRTPDQCNFPVGVLCTGAKVTTTSVTVNLNNGLGNKMIVCGLACDDSVKDMTEVIAKYAALGGTGGDCSDPPADNVIDVGQAKIMTFTKTGAIGCTDLNDEVVTLGNKYRGKLFLAYYLYGDTGISRIMQGTMEATVQP